MEVPSKELSGVVETVFGKTGAKILITIIVLWAVISAVGGAWTTLKALYDGAAPFIPATVPDWVLPFVIAPILILALGYLIGLIYGRLNTVGILVATLLGTTQETTDELDKEKAKARAIEDRVKYLESQVGDELLNVLVERSLKAQGIQMGPLRRELEAIPEAGMNPKWSDEGKRKVKKGRAWLFEAAQLARDAGDAKGDLLKLTNQAWFITQCRAMVGNCFGFSVFKPFEDMLELRGIKRQQVGQVANASEILLNIAVFFESRIPLLKPDDVETILEKPETFADFMRAK